VRLGVLGQLLLVGVLIGSGMSTSARSAFNRSRPPVGDTASILRIGAGGYSGYAVLSNGRVWAWGDDLEGQIGDAGPWTSRTTPVEVAVISGAVLVTGGGNSAYALQRNGTVWAWGDDSAGELADARRTARNVPRPVPNLNEVSSVGAGAFAVYVIRRDGTAWSWGDNSFGELGTGSKAVGSAVPRELARLRGVREIVAGSADGYALLDNGTVWAFGDNSLGQLGDGACGGAVSGRPPACLASSAPEQVPGLAGVIAIAAGGDSGYALRRDGSVWAWGDDEFGELGNGVVRLDEDSPVKVKGLGHVVAIAAGSCSGYALLRNGRVWAWGRGDFGQLGDGATLQRNLPVEVKGLTDVVQVVGGGDMAYALERDGALWAWGANAYGQLGNDSVENRDLPARVLGPPGFGR
jgi:alpha-tubulin suppressor-like RCC1 family protein